eukprot:s282_g37.t2
MVQLPWLNKRIQTTISSFGGNRFIQLARELNTLHEKAKEQAMNQLMEEVQFNQKEVNQFHEVPTSAASAGRFGPIWADLGIAGVRPKGGGVLPRAVAFSCPYRTFATSDDARKKMQCFQDGKMWADVGPDDDDIEEAQEAVEKVVQVYEDLLSSLPAEGRREFEDANGLKMKSLKEEFAQLLDDDDH